MSIRPYLPSAQLLSIAGAFALSGGLVLAAQYVTKGTTPPTIASSDPSPLEGDWKDTLAEIQARSGLTLPESPTPEVVAQLLEAAKSPNITGTVARTLLVNLTNAKAQGLGDDIPTQEQLVASAAAHVQSSAGAPLFSSADIKKVAANSDTVRTYGNAVMATMAAHPNASAQKVILGAGYALDYHGASNIALVKTTGEEYLALARDLARLPVPGTLAPLHLQAANDLAAMGKGVLDLSAVLDDPLKGLAGLQTFEAKGDETARVFTTIAENLNKDGILFTKDEPGSAWSVFLSSSVQ